MTIEGNSLKQTITERCFFDLIPQFIEIRNSSPHTIKDAIIWRKVLEDNGYNPDLVSSLYYFMYDKSGKIRSEYCYALKKAPNGGNKDLKRIDIKNNRNIDTGIQHPALDVADPHLLEENADFMRNY